MLIVTNRRAVTAIVASDTEETGDGLRWFWGFAQADMPSTSGAVVPLGDEEFFLLAAESIEEELKRFQPSFIREHKRDGTAMGTVERIEVLTREEAKARFNIDLATDREAFFGIKLSDEGREIDDRGGFNYTSINMHFGAEEAGKRWPAYLKELSATAVPKAKENQLKRGDVRHLVLSDTEGSVTPEERAAIVADVTEAVLAALKTEMADDTEDDKGDKEEPMVEAADTDDETAETVVAGEPDERDAQIKQLQEQMAAMRLERTRERLTADAASQHLVLSDGDIDTLVTLKLSDETAFGAVWKGWARKPLASAKGKRSAQHGATVVASDDPQAVLHAKTVALQKTRRKAGKTDDYGECLTLVLSDTEEA